MTSEIVSRAREHALQLVENVDEVWLYREVQSS